MKYQKYTRSQIISWGKEALEVESNAIRDACYLLDEDFAMVVQGILQTTGRVILTGLGKSGHIARKIAATLASTGTSSFYIHPSEALHGDLGMICNQDVLVAIAFRGNTSEVLEVVEFARRVGVMIVAICGNRDSSLAKLADYYLDAHVEKEACPLNLAPTSSTTVTLAIGDALAVALMTARGFKKEDFACFHPGGTLGKRLSLVIDHMRPRESLACCYEGDSFQKVLENVTKNNFGIAPVLSKASKLIGVITDGDLRRAISRCRANVFALMAADLMTNSPKVINKQAFAIDAFREMEKTSITALFVIESQADNELIGIIRMHDLLTAKII